MQQKDMSNEKPMGIAAKWPRVRYSAAYPTDAPEKLCFGGKPHEVRPKGPQGAARGAYRERDSFTLVVCHYGVTVSINSDPFVPVRAQSGRS